MELQEENVVISPILIAHDGSPEVRCAAEVGIDLARRYHARATLLTAIHHPAYPATVGEIQEADSEMRQFVDGIQREAIEYGRLHGSNLGAVVLSGHPAEAIVDYARQYNVDLILLGTSRRVESASILRRQRRRPRRRSRALYGAGGQA